jgi:hypothetical protein
MKSVTRQIVDKIILDIENRQGLGDEWGLIDDETQKEIIAKWVSIIEKIVQGGGNENS